MDQDLRSRLHRLHNHQHDDHSVARDAIEAILAAEAEVKRLQMGNDIAAEEIARLEKRVKELSDYIFKRCKYICDICPIAGTCKMSKKETNNGLD